MSGESLQGLSEYFTGKKTMSTSWWCYGKNQGKTKVSSFHRLGGHKYVLQIVQQCIQQLLRFHCISYFSPDQNVGTTNQPSKSTSLEPVDQLKTIPYSIIHKCSVHMHISHKIYHQTLHLERQQIFLTSNLKRKSLLYFHITLSNHHCIINLSHLADVQGHASLHIQAVPDRTTCCFKGWGLDEKSKYC